MVSSGCQMLAHDSMMGGVGGVGASWEQGALECHEVLGNPATDPALQDLDHKQQGD